jgi:DNA-binding NarL/FixJ family response regulator
MRRVREGAQGEAPVSALSAQEKRVLDLIGDGLTNRQIAEHMSLSEKTAKNYVSSVLTKLGMHRRSQAAAFAARLAGASGQLSRPVIGGWAHRRVRCRWPGLVAD